MNEQDIFVGLVATCLGLYFCASAIANAPWFTKFWLIRYLDQSIGSNWARGIGLLIGVIFALIGILLMLGIFSQSSRQSAGQSQADCNLSPAKLN